MFTSDNNKPNAQNSIFLLRTPSRHVNCIITKTILHVSFGYITVSLLS